MHDLTVSRPRIHVDDDINRYLQDHPRHNIEHITYNTRAVGNTIREEALVTFSVIEPSKDLTSIISDIFSNDLGADVI